MSSDFSLRGYTQSLTKSESPFFVDQAGTRSYADLIKLSLTIAQDFKTNSDDYLVLQFESSYLLFAHLLGSLFAKKNVLILSFLEPEHAVKNHQKHFPYTRILNDKSASEAFVDLTNIPEVDFSTRAFNILSSGSSGPAKSIPLTLENVYTSSKSVIDFFEMNKNHTTFLNLPHNHIGGLMLLWRAFFSGGCVSLIDSRHYDFISLVPLQLKRKLAVESEIQKLKKCTAILIGGALFDQDLKNQAARLNLATYETYGMSETCSLVMLNGTPLKNQNIKLDPEGHFLIKGKTISPLMPLDSEGYYHTKDIGRINEDGTFSFLYRSDLLFKSAGEMIDPQKIEAVAKEFPEISNAVVVGIPHPQWSHASVLVYQSTRDNIEADIKDYLKKELHPYLVPRFFMKAPAHLMNNEMKPKRHEIKEFAVKKFFTDKLHFLYVPAENSQTMMVYLHGFMEDHSDMIPLMDNHKEMSHLLIDLPGHGKSLMHAFSSRDEFLTTLMQLIKVMAQGQDIIFYGYSMGGRIALEMINRGLIPKLAFFESSAFGLATQDEKTQRLESDLKLFSNFKDHQSFFDNWYSNPIFGNYKNSPNYLLDIEKKSLHDFSEWKASLNFLSPGSSPFTINDSLTALKNIKTIALFGEHDEKYKQHFFEMKKAMPDLQLFEIKGAAHNAHKTHVHEVKKIIKENIL